jgi:hypothetical protein
MPCEERAVSQELQVNHSAADSFLAAVLNQTAITTRGLSSSTGECMHFLT